MTEPRSKTQAYLEALEDGLEALGPEETHDVITEIRGLIAEATLDVGGDERTALANLGAPKALAENILAERGILSPHSLVPEARLGLQATAAAIDLILSLAAIAFLHSFASRGLYAAYYWGYASPVLTVLAWTAGAALLGSLAWWWARKRRRPGYASTGMEAVGIRRIRIGDTRRVVRARDIPGSPAYPRFMPKVKIAVAMLILAAFVLGVAYSREAQWQAEIENAVMQTGVSTGVVTSVYRDVMLGRGMSSLLPSTGPYAEEDMAALLERYAAGEFDSYMVFMTRLPDRASAETDFSDPLADTAVIVLVIETAPGDGPDAIYEYTVRSTTESAEGGPEGGYYIESVALVDS